MPVGGARSGEEGCARHLLRRTYSDARGPGEARDRHRRAATSGPLLVHTRRMGFQDRPTDRRIPAESARPRRHLPTVSRSTSQRTPLTGTCFNRCGARTFPNRGSPAWRVNENRHDLPVLLRRPRRRPGARGGSAEVLIERGHKVSVLAPSSDDDELPDFCGFRR